MHSGTGIQSRSCQLFILDVSTAVCYKFSNIVLDLCTIQNFERIWKGIKMKRKVPKWPIRRLSVVICVMWLFSMLAGCSGGSEETMQSEEMVHVEHVELNNAEEANDSIDDSSEQNVAVIQGADDGAEDGIEIAEADRSELTLEILEENELDTSVVEGTKTTKGCTFDLPEGFEESEDVPGLFVTKRYPIDASNIYYAEMDRDISMQLLTEEAFLQRTRDAFMEQFGMETDIKLESFERFSLDGYPAFRIVCSYVLDDLEITQTEYVINADKSYCITYSQTSEYDRTEEFESSAATIRVES